MSEVKEFLKSKGLDPENIVIYDMTNVVNPRVDIEKWLIEFKNFKI